MRIGRMIAIAAMALVGATVSAQVPKTAVAPLTPAPALTAVEPVGAGGAHALAATDVDAWLDGYMPYALRSGDLAGAVVVIVKDGQVLNARGFGYADIAKKKPVDPYRTLFRPGSVTKLITWTAVMQQVEAGKLDLDKDVNTWLDFKIPPYQGKPITLRQIMTHTAGFEEAAKDIITYDPRQKVDFGAYLRRWTPRRIYAPGTTPAYSNWATTLAAYIVQRVSGTPFDTYVEQRIFAPLDMRYSSFRQPLPANLAPFMATGYPRASAPAKGFEFVGPAPAGSMSASGVDMAKFMIAHLDQGRGLLQPATAATMHNSPLDRVDPMSLIPPLNRMELGFFETNVNDRWVIGHLGDLENFHTSLHLFMNEHVGLYVSFNSGGREGAAQTVRGQLFQDFADRYFPATKPDGRVDAKTAAEHAKLMVGEWQNSRHSESNFVNVLALIGPTAITLDKDGGLLIPALHGPGGAPRQWDEIAPFVWRERGGHDRLAAKVVDGRVVRWSFDGLSPFMVFDPVPASRSSALLMPLLYASLAVLLFSVLYWPFAWYVRRRHKAQPVVSGQGFRLYRATRIMALADLAVLGGWMLLVTTVLSDTSALTDKSDIWLWLLQILGAIVFVGAVGIAGWNAWVAWRDGRHWTRKVWSTLILLATFVVLYFAHAGGLLAMTVNY